MNSNTPDQWGSPGQGRPEDSTNQPEMPQNQPSAPQHQPSAPQQQPGPAAPVYGSVPPPYGQPAYPSSGYDQQQADVPRGYGQQGYGQQGYAQPGYGDAGATQGGYESYGQQGFGQYPQAQPQFGQTAPPGYPPMNYPAPIRTDYASWPRRAGGILIDQLPALIAQAVFWVGYVQWIIGIAESGSAPTLNTGAGLGWMVAGGILMLAALGWSIYNRWFLAGRTGQSIGRRATHISLISEQTGQPIGPLNAFVRDLCHILDGVAYVGYLWPLWDEKKQTFADKLMKTVVVDARQQAAP